MSEPDLTTEVIGYRQWRVTPDLKLRAAHKRQRLWLPGENVATCDPDFDSKRNRTPKPCKHAPGRKCHCGLYGLYDPSDFWYGRNAPSMNHFWMTWDTAEEDPLISGVIVGWGALEVHHQGFRAERARVVALGLSENRRDAVIVRAVAAEYGVPAVPIDKLPQIATEYGVPVPVDMRPEKPETIESKLTALISGSLWTPSPGGSWHYYSPSLVLGSGSGGGANVQWTSIDPAQIAPTPPVSRKQSNRQGPPRKKRPPRDMRPGKGL